MSKNTSIGTRFKSYVGRKLRSKRFWKRTIMTVLVVPILLFTITVLIVYWKQDAIVQSLIKDMNKDFVGHTEIKDSHVSLFENFPYISIDLESVLIHETKEKNTTPIVDVDDIYVGFDLWTIITGDMEIKKIKLKEGKLNLIQHEDGEFNIVKALTSQAEVDDANEEFHLDLRKIELENIDLSKLNEANNVLIDAYINSAHSSFKTSPHHVYATLDAKFELNLLKDGDTTFIKHKHFELDTRIDFLQEKEIMKISPTIVKLEGAEFNMEGSIDFLNDALLDLKFDGSKPNFELFIAMAPEELIPTLKRYENKGQIFFSTTIKGKSINGHNPAINAEFGCKQGFFNNNKVKKKLRDLNFAGSFTNGDKRTPETMQFRLQEFSARPDAGEFSGHLTVTNFNTPEIDLEVTSRFELDFLAKFFNMNDLSDLKGDMALTMKFRDIIDIDSPEKSLERFNESYYMKLKMDDINFKSESFPLAFKDINMFAEVNGHEARIDYCKAKVGKSDVNILGTISDLPAIIHHSSIPVDTRLNIKSKYLDLYELTGSDSTAIDEQISNLSLNLDFKSSAKAITESPNLPIGEFFIEDLHAQLKHYPHTLHDFHADVFIEDHDFRVLDFQGMIDKSDFFFSGKLNNYNMWFDEHPKGDTKVEFNLKSKMLQLEDVFAYKGENYVPEEYRHEEFDDLHTHGFVYMHFNEGLQSVDLTLDHFNTKMKVHPLKFENFNGRVHYEKDHLVVEDFHGKLGKSKFKTTLHYYLGDDESIKLRDNHFSIDATRLDIDQLIKYNPPPVTQAITNNSLAGAKSTVDHDAGFNIYELPFTDMTFDINIGHLNYHKYLMHNVSGKFHTKPNHHITVDHFHIDAAGGSFDITGEFNGADPNKIYFDPKIKVKNVDLDKLMLKFDNFGQDHLVSENLHGKLSGTIWGNIHVHNDLVPKIDDSEIHMDIDVLNGQLENYALLDYMSDYFRDKNIKKVRFDTLSNHIDLTNGTLNIPKMSINSSLGHMEISGKQGTDEKMSMEYYLSVPWSMVTDVAASKLFGRKKDQVPDTQIDEIQYANEDKKTRYVGVKIIGDIENYQISLGKKKKKRTA